MLRNLNRRSIILITVVSISCIVLASFALWQMVASARGSSVATSPTPTPTSTEVTPTSTPAPMATLTPTPPPLHSGPIMGINGDPSLDYQNIYWIRLSYPSCGWGNLKGSTLKSTIQSYHQKGIHILLIVCGPGHGGGAAALKDAAKSGPDAMQCGNEQMKYGPDATTFAYFYNQCEHEAHAVSPNIPVLMGSLDPHVGGIDYQPLVGQVGYLDQMEFAMNTRVHHGGHWHWRDHTIGLIDSWHNGYPNGSVNSLRGLFDFWAQQFRVNTGGGPGGLGRHLWVIEGTGCFKGCGLNTYDAAEIAISHILTLITDVQTARGYHVPFFYFSGQDFTLSDGVTWPIGILDLRGHPKPLRQDLGMGARTLQMSCQGKSRVVKDQLQLLAALYQGCDLPSNYVGILSS